jgi:hypothetical protein
MYMRIAALFREIETGVGLGEKHFGQSGGDLRERNSLSVFYEQYLVPMLEDFERLDLRISRQWAEQIQRCILSSSSSTPFTATGFAELLKSLRGTLEKELREQLVYLVPRDRAEFIEPTKPLFDDRCRTQFPLAVLEIERAGKAYAFGLPNACVFHLMRATEHGLHALGRTLKLPEFNPTWDAILKKCDEELQKPWQQRDEHWRANEAFYSGATAQLRAVKTAWRNPVMHVDRDYSDDEAYDVLTATSALIRHLGKQIGESTT